MLFKICALVSSSFGCDRKFPKGWGLCTSWGPPRRPLCSFCSVPPGRGALGVPSPRARGVQTLDLSTLRKATTTGLSLHSFEG